MENLTVSYYFWHRIFVSTKRRNVFHNCASRSGWKGKNVSINIGYKDEDEARTQDDLINFRGTH